MADRAALPTEMRSGEHSLRRPRTKVLGLIVPSMAAGVSEFIRGVSHAARDRGYSLAVSDGRNSMRAIESELDRLYDERVDGLVLGGSTPAPRQIGRFIRAGIPIGPDVTDPDWRRVQIDDGWAPPTRAAYRCLLEHGHRRVVFSAPIERDEGYMSSMTRFRLRTLEETLAERGLGFDADCVVQLCEGDECGPVLQQLLRGPGRATAVVCGDAGFLAAIFRALGELALEVPRDVSILSFGEAGWEATYRPPISAVRHDCFAVGHRYAEDVIARIEERPILDPMRRFPAEFAVRGSIGPAPGA
jgi:LacI family transcriptional regulator